MNELIRITEKDGKKAVSARELYDRLGFASQHWAKWYEKNITKNSFAVEGDDFAQLPLSGRTKDFALSIDFAKKLAMLARTEAGERIRQYFVEVEKVAVATMRPQSALDIMEMSLKILREQSERVEVVEKKVNQLEARTATRPDYFTIMGFAVVKGIKISTQSASKYGSAAMRICKKKGYDIGKVPDPRFGYVGNYPREVLEEVFATPVF